jgi:hypothetical protein
MELKDKLKRIEARFANKNDLWKYMTLRCKQLNSEFNRFFF